MRRGLPSRLFETIQETFACTNAPVFSYSCVPTQTFSLPLVFTKRHKIQDDTSLVGSRPDHLRKLTPCSQGSLILLTYLSSRKLRHFEIRRWAVFHIYTYKRCRNGKRCTHRSWNTSAWSWTTSGRSTVDSWKTEIWSDLERESASVRTPDSALISSPGLSECER